MDLRDLLDSIKRSAERRIRRGATARAAYRNAIVEVLSRAAEKMVDPFEASILTAIRARNGRPVSTTALQVELGVDSRYSMYNYLEGLERRGLIARVRPRSGWVIVEEVDRRKVA